LEDHGVFTDGEVLTRASLSGIGTTSQGGAVLRASASEDSGYIAAIREPSPGNIVLRLIRFSSGSSETLNDAPISLTANQAYYIRFRAEGADLSAKFWVDGDDEPATWTVHARDSEHESGMAGIGKLSGGYHSRWNTVVVNRGGGAA